MKGFQVLLYMMRQSWLINNIQMKQVVSSMHIVLSYKYCMKIYFQIILLILYGQYIWNHFIAQIIHQPHQLVVKNIIKANLIVIILKLMIILLIHRIHHLVILIMINKQIGLIFSKNGCIANQLCHLLWIYMII